MKRKYQLEAGLFVKDEVIKIIKKICFANDITLNLEDLGGFFSSTLLITVESDVEWKLNLLSDTLKRIGDTVNG